MPIRRRSDTFKQLALGRLRVGGPKTTPRNTSPRQQKRMTRTTAPAVRRALKAAGIPGEFYRCPEQRTYYMADDDDSGLLWGSTEGAICGRIGHLTPAQVVATVRGVGGDLLREYMDNPERGPQEGADYRAGIVRGTEPPEDRSRGDHVWISVAPAGGCDP